MSKKATLGFSTAPAAFAQPLVTELGLSPPVMELPLAVVELRSLDSPGRGTVVGGAVDCGLVTGGWLPDAVPGVVAGATLLSGMPGKVIGA
jgi:hypothetical protein